MSFSIERYLVERRVVVENHLRAQLTLRGRWPARLYEVMNYAVFSGGKRLRPILALAAWDALAPAKGRQGWETVLPAACAVELVHCYSLVHDDLPCMDDDDERRGQPTVHIKYGQAMALLTGDALLTEAFALLGDGARNGGQEGPRAGMMVAELARAAGARGMVGGQSMDLGEEGAVDDLGSLNFLHRRKTGELIRTSLWLGGFCARASKPRLEALAKVGDCLGLAFQIADDLLDAAEDPEREAADGAPSYLRFLSPEEARQRADALVEQALEALSTFDHRADPLRSLARYLVQRDH